MHWRAHWWGTELVSDNKEDEKILKDLSALLDKKPLITYEFGKLETNEKPYTGDCGPDGGFTLTFNR